MNAQTNDSTLISQLEAWLPHGQRLPAGLYLVATPIGNAADITLRALWVLAKADIIACEDTRTTRQLMERYGITTPLMAYHDHNADNAGEKILEQLRAGKLVALVSDAGTPLISDPGYGLVQRVVESGFHLSSIPGACAAITALTLAELPTDHFLFAGFLPPKTMARRKALEALASLPYSLVFYEAPHRLAESLRDMQEVFGNEREACVLRELTKLHEERRSASLLELAAHYETTGAPKGECVVVVQGKRTDAPLCEGEIEAFLEKLLADHPVKEAARMAADHFAIPRQQAYTLALKLKTS